MQHTQKTQEVYLPLANVRLDGDTQARVKLCEETVSKYVEHYKDAIEVGDEYPCNGMEPIDCVFDGEYYWVYDGFHRCLAATRVGLHTICVRVVSGTLDDARWLACNANIKTTLARTNADKRRAVQMALALQPGYSDRAIARHCGVSHNFVSETRGHLSSDDRCTSRTATRNGREYTIDTANIGRRTVPAEAVKPPAPGVDSAPARKEPSTLTYATLCSGVEGASVACADLGWEPVYFAEVDPFCCRLLEHHHPGVPNLGDITKITPEMVRKVAEEMKCKSSLQGRRASRFRWRGCDWAWVTTVASSRSSSFDGFARTLLAGSSGKTSPAFCPQTEDGLSLPSSGRWGNFGMGTATGCWTLNTSESRRGVVGSSLSDILETTPADLSQCYLTQKQHARILERADKNRVSIPPEIQTALERGMGMKPQSSLLG